MGDAAGDRAASATAPQEDNPHLAVLAKFQKKAEEERAKEEQRKRVEAEIQQQAKIQHAVLDEGVNVHQMILARYAERKRQQEKEAQEKLRRNGSGGVGGAAAPAAEVIERPPGPVLPTLDGEAEVIMGSKGRVGRRRLVVEDRLPLTVKFFEQEEKGSGWAKKPCDTLAIPSSALLIDNVVADEMNLGMSKTMAKKEAKSSIFQTFRSVTSKSTRARPKETTAIMIETVLSSFIFKFDTPEEREIWHDGLSAYFEKYGISGEMPEESPGQSASSSPTAKPSPGTKRRNPKDKFAVFDSTKKDVVENPLADDWEETAAGTVFANALYEG